MPPLPTKQTYLTTYINPASTLSTCLICTWAYDERTHPAVQISPCNHTFGHNCILRWLESNNICPMCFTPLYLLPTNTTARTASSASGRSVGNRVEEFPPPPMGGSQYSTYGRPELDISRASPAQREGSTRRTAVSDGSFAGCRPLRSTDQLPDSRDRRRVNREAEALSLPTGRWSSTFHPTSHTANNTHRQAEPSRTAYSVDNSRPERSLDMRRRPVESSGQEQVEWSRGGYSNLELVPDEPLVVRRRTAEKSETHYSTDAGSSRGRSRRSSKGLLVSYSTDETSRGGRRSSSRRRLGVYYEKEYYE